MSGIFKGSDQVAICDLDAKTIQTEDDQLQELFDLMADEGVSVMTGDSDDEEAHDEEETLEMSNEISGVIAHELEKQGYTLKEDEEESQ